MIGDIEESLESIAVATMFAGHSLNDNSKDLARVLVYFRTKLRTLKNGLKAEHLTNDDLENWNTVFKLVCEIEDAFNKTEVMTAQSIKDAISEIEDAKAFVASLPREQHALTDQAIRDAVFAMTDGKCSYCSVVLVREGGGNNQFCIEHVVPASKGGPNHLTNYVPSCLGCNSAKSDRHVLHFIRNVLPARIQTNVIPIKEVQAPLPAMPEIRIVAGDRE